MKLTPQLVYVRWASGIFMMLVLLWLTVSAPFVTSFQQRMAEREEATHKNYDESCQEPEAAECNPFANATEEKTASSSVNFSEEYLHDHDDIIHTPDDLLKHDNCGHSTLYISFYGELLSPPPEV